MILITKNLYSIIIKIKKNKPQHIVKIEKIMFRPLELRLINLIFVADT